MEQKTEASQAVDEHKPCPFCGTAPRYLAKQEGIYCELVICDTCGLGLAPSSWNRRAALKAQPAPTEVQGDAVIPASGFPVTIADAKFAIKQMQDFVNTDPQLCLLLDDNIHTLRTFVHSRAELAFAERIASKQVQGEDSARLDAVVEANRALLHERSQLGIKKYGGTLAEKQYPHRELLTHALLEALDLSNYLQAAIMGIDRASAETGGVK